jgi:hypothetical protein
MPNQSLAIHAYNFKQLMYFKIQFDPTFVPYKKHKKLKLEASKP